MFWVPSIIVAVGIGIVVLAIVVAVIIVVASAIVGGKLLLEALDLFEEGFGKGGGFLLDQFFEHLRVDSSFIGDFHISIISGFFGEDLSREFLQGHSLLGF